MNNTQRSGSRHVGALASLALAATALAGGGPENVLIIINPASAESMYLGHYYQFARNIPAQNILYIDPAAPSYQALASANGNIDALFGKLNNSRLNPHIDYVVVAAPATFFVSAPGHVQDGCWPVARFSQTSVFATSFIRPQILAGGLTSQESNRYYGNTAFAFDSGTSWLGGLPSTSANARRYFIVSQLGYTGPLGNTVGDITTMIDRSVASDGTRPAGKFYFMNTTDAIRNVRSPGFTTAVSTIIAAGGQAEIINGVLPDFRHDCLGILTGWADPDIDGATYTILPGSFCDHLTSWAATFDIGFQTKMSAWIRRGAAGTCGTVEEPCNYTGKFPAPHMHVMYRAGLSLGEAWFRSMAYTPFQIMFQGDPVTRPWSTFPAVTGNVPAGTFITPVSFTPVASTSLPGASIASIELYINGSLQSTKFPGSPFTINPGALPDGPNEVRILAYDNTAVRTVGRWVGTLNAGSYGRTVTLNLGPPSGTMTTSFTGNISTTGPGIVREVRLIHNGRVLAAAPTAPAALSIFGRNIGPGKTNIQAEVLYMDGTRALSQPTLVDIAFTAGTPAGASPVAHSFYKRIMRGSSAVVELPATFDDSLAGATFTVLTNPAQATIGAGTIGYRVITAAANACGSTTMTFRVDTPSGQSNTGTVTLVYDSGPDCAADFDGNGNLNANDFVHFVNGFATGALRNDMNGDCNLNAVDFIEFINAYAVGCPVS